MCQTRQQESPDSIRSHKDDYISIVLGAICSEKSKELKKPWYRDQTHGQRNAQRESITLSGLLTTVR